MKKILVIVLPALAVIILDQLVKWFMLARVGMETRPPIEVTDFFRLVMVWNHGVSFGMLTLPSAAMPWLLMALALVISAVLLRLALKSGLLGERVGYGMIIGGALGNVIDRLRFGAVADFFYFHWHELGWPAFNVADAAICLGVGMLLWRMLRPPARP
jgi:signal peptidase II